LVNVTAGKTKTLAPCSSEKISTGYVALDVLAPMSKVPRTVPSTVKAQVVPLCRYMEKAWVPAVTVPVPPPRIVFVPRFQIW
jgi:hypothetical protein